MYIAEIAFSGEMSNSAKMSIGDICRCVPPRDRGQAVGLWVGERERVWITLRLQQNLAYEHEEYINNDIKMYYM